MKKSFWLALPQLQLLIPHHDFHAAVLRVADFHQNGVYLKVGNKGDFDAQVFEEGFAAFFEGVVGEAVFVHVGVDG